MATAAFLCSPLAAAITDLLVEQGVKLVVVACNSAESTAFYVETGRYDIPIVSVIEPGVNAAIAATRNRRGRVTALQP